MAKGVLAHRPDSIYDDLPESHYQFPKMYLTRVEQTIGDWIVYYEPRGGGGRLGYNSIAKVVEIVPDNGKRDHYNAIIDPSTFITFDHFVGYFEDDAFLESGLNTGTKKPSARIRSAVRIISDQDFFRIVSRGLRESDTPLPRSGDTLEPTALGLREEPTDFSFEIDRERFEQITSRPKRDRVFRAMILGAYDKTCAFTGLRLINGGGRAEVEAAHIRPVEKGGPDSPRNGIALSGTVHWMFDRGLMSLSDEGKILVSRHVNDRRQVENLLGGNSNAILPKLEALRPHPNFLQWHRENCFKH
jgi:putative restriction endonuclease